MRISLLLFVIALLSMNTMNAQMGVFMNINPNPMPNPLVDGTTYSITMDYDNTNLVGTEWVNQTNAIQINSGLAVFGPINLFGNQISFTVTPLAGGGPLSFTFEANDGSSNGWAVFNYAEAVLPVSLSGFDARLNGDDITISWETEVEINHDHFILQRSADGYKFEDLERFEAFANNGDGAEYDYRDIGVTDYESESIYYRLKQVDHNGMYVFSDRLVVMLPKQYDQVFEIEEIEKLSSNELLLHLHSKMDESVFIQISNMTGQYLLNQFKPVSEGSNMIRLGIKEVIPIGVYIVTVKSKYNQVSEKIMF